MSCPASSHRITLNLRSLQSFPRGIEFRYQIHCSCQRRSGPKSRGGGTRPVSPAIMGSTVHSIFCGRASSGHPLSGTPTPSSLLARCMRRENPYIKPPAGLLHPLLTLRRPWWWISSWAFLPLVATQLFRQWWIVSQRLPSSCHFLSSPQLRKWEIFWFSTSSSPP